MLARLGFLGGGGLEVVLGAWLQQVWAAWEWGAGAWLDGIALDSKTRRGAALGQQMLLQALAGPLALAAVAAMPALQHHLCDPPCRRRQQAAAARQRLVQLPLFPDSRHPVA